MTQWHGFFLVWIALAALPTPARAEASAGAWRYVPRGTSLAVLAAGASPESAASGQVELGCAAQALLEHEAQLYVACGTAGMVLLSIAQPERPVVVAHRLLGGEVLGFWVADGTVWVKLRRLEARPVGEIRAGAGDEAAPRPLSAPTPLATSRMAAAGGPEARRPVVAGAAKADREGSDPDATGRVVELGVGDVLIDLGGAAGLRRDDRVELFVRERVALGRREAAEQEQVVAVGVVTVVSPQHARVRLGMNERVPLGAGARRSRLPVTQSIVAPPRVGGTYELKATVRPFFTLGAVGFGMLNDLALGYRFERPIYVGVTLSPIGFAAGGGRTIVAALAQAVAALDLPLFSVGFGVGLGTPNAQFGGGNAAFATMQLVRLGALDGLNVEVQNTLLIYDDEFRHGATTGAIQIPVSPRWWLLLRGGGGRVGYGYGEAGLRVRVQGHGRHGSVFLNATVGGGALVEGGGWGSRGGPLAGIGVEWRP
ncbi:MAG: hypothetical protein IPL40_03570 [Proteobacteria bacterium]|nr:hypothetical protein [Pseudomonadota bacterium]